MRIRRKYKRHFTQVANEALNDDRLSLDTKGLLAWFLSLPDDWAVRHTHVMTKLQIGWLRLRRMVRELIDAGYLEREDDQPRDSSNRFMTFNYVVKDEPSQRRAVVDFPRTEDRARKVDNDINTKKKYESQIPSIQNLPPTLPQPVTPQGTGGQKPSSIRAAAEAQGLVFVIADSKPYDAWFRFRGPDGMPPPQHAEIDGRSRDGVWMPALWPPRHRQDDQQ